MISKLGNVPDYFGKHIRTVVTPALVVLVPVVALYFIARVIFVNVDSILQPVFTAIFGRPIPGAGFLLIILLLYLLGVFLTTRIGKRLQQKSRQVLLKTPIIGTPYAALTQLVECVGLGKQPSYKRVVALEYPRQGMWALGLVTGSVRLSQSPDQGELLVVYVPSAPVPSSGWVAILPARDVYDTDLTVQDALKLILSVGTLPPTAARRDEKALAGGPNPEKVPALSVSPVYTLNPTTGPAPLKLGGNPSPEGL